MAKDSKYSDECMFFSKALEYTATFYATLYLVCILVPIIMTIYTLAYAENSYNTTLTIIALALSILPFPLRNNIERVQIYRDLSIKFSNLQQDIEEDGHNNYLKKLKILKSELSNTNINPIIRYIMNKKNETSK